MKKIFFIFILFSIFFIKDSDCQKKINVIFRIDDYGIDNTNFYPNLFAIFKHYDVKLVVAVVPFKEENKKIIGLKEYERDILVDGLNKGVIEVSLHGYLHKNYSKNINDQETEFKGISYKTQYYEIKKGLDYLEKELKIKIDNFVPPFNSYDKNTIRVLDTLGFKNISAAIYDTPDVPKSYFTRLSFIPFTTTLKNLDYSIKNAQRSDQEVVIVVMMHAPEFIENIPFYRNNKDIIKYYKILGQNNFKFLSNAKYNLKYLEMELLSLTRQKDVRITTFNQLNMDKNLLKFNTFNANIVNYFPSLPSFMHFKESGYYPENEIALVSTLKYKLYPLTIYLLLFGFGGYLGYLFHKSFRNKIFIYFQLYISVFILLVMVYTFLNFHVGYFEIVLFRYYYRLYYN